MEDTSMGLDYWRVFFRAPDRNIFDIIENAINVASADFPSELRNKREIITELLFNYKSTDSSIAYEKVGSDKASEIVNGDEVHNNNHGDNAETCMMDELKFVDEVFRIKDILDQSQEQSNIMLFDSLRKLEQMNLSVEDLQDSGIGKSVSALRKHRSEDVQNLASNIVRHWKDMVKAYVSTSKANEEVVTITPIVKDDLRNSKKISENQDHQKKLNIEDSKASKGLKIRIKINSKTAGQTNSSTEQKKVVPCRRKTMDYNDETSIEMKLENSKRKLHDRYEEIEKAKKQKKIKLMEFKDLPDQKHRTNAHHQSSGNCRSLMSRVNGVRPVMQK